MPSVTGLIEGPDSLFTYPSGMTFMDFRNDSFVPLFEPQFEDEAKRLEAESICGDDKSCLLDFSVTGNKNFAAASMEALKTHEDNKIMFGRCIVHISIAYWTFHICFTANEKNEMILLTIHSLVNMN